MLIKPTISVLTNPNRNRRIPEKYTNEPRNSYSSSMWDFDSDLVTTPSAPTDMSVEEKKRWDLMAGAAHYDTKDFLSVAIAKAVRDPEMYEEIAKLARKRAIEHAGSSLALASKTIGLPPTVLMQVLRLPYHEMSMLQNAVYPLDAANVQVNEQEIEEIVNIAMVTGVMEAAEENESPTSTGMSPKVNPISRILKQKRR